MLKKIIITKLLLIAILSLNAQQISFIKDYNVNNRNSRAEVIRQTPDKGYILGGRSAAGWFDDDYTLLKTDSLGNMQWYHHFGEETNFINSICILPDTSYVIAGNTNYNEYMTFQEQASLIKYNSFGDTIWYKTYGKLFDEDSSFYYTDDVFKDIIYTKDSCLLAVGYSQSYTQFTNSQFPFIVKTDTAGNIIWQWVWPDNIELTDESAAGLYSVIETSDGDYVAFGGTSNHLQLKNRYLNGNMGLIIKISSEGELLWYREWDKIWDVRAENIVEHKDGSFYFCGKLPMRCPDYDVDSCDQAISFIAHVDSDGRNIDYKIIDYAYDTGIYKLLLNDNYLTAFYMITPYKDWEIWKTDVYIEKYNISEGYDLLWNRTIGTASIQDRVHDAVLTHDGGYAYCSYNYQANNMQLVKLDSLAEGVGADGWQPDGIANNEIKQLIITPNPADKFVYINLPENTSQEVDIEIINNQGRTIRTINDVHKTDRINLSGITNGFYIIKAKSKDYNYIGKLIVKH